MWRHGAAIFKEKPRVIFTPVWSNPNQAQLAAKFAVLEGLDLLRANPKRSTDEIVGGHVFTSGMAAVSTALLARVKQGETIIAQKALYGATFTFLNDLAPKFGIQVEWVDEWISNTEAAFKRAPKATAVYAESRPTRPWAVDLKALAELQTPAWGMAVCG